MTIRSKKLVSLLVLILWYYVMTFFITPYFMGYMFETNTIIAELFSEILTICIPILVILFRKKERGKPELLFSVYTNKLKTVKKKKVFIWLGLSGFVGIAMTYIFAFYDIVYILNKKDYSIVNIIPDFDIWIFIFSIITIVIIPPIFEEIAYRGMYYDTLYDTNDVLTFFVPSLIFATLHGSLTLFVNAFVISIFLLFCYRQTKSLKLIILMHMISNFISYLFSNIITYPLSPLMALNEYANDNQMYGLLLFYTGIIIAFITLIVICIIVLKPKKINLGITNKFNRLELCLLLFILCIAVIMFIIKITI